MALLGLKSDLQLKWREPWMVRLRLHRDLGPRLLMGLACSIAIASLFFLAATLEAGGNALVGAALGGVIFGILSCLGFIGHWDNLYRSVVQVRASRLDRNRETFRLGPGVSVRERWQWPHVTGAIVPSGALNMPFSVLVLSGCNGKYVLIGIPANVDLEEIRQQFSENGAAIEIAPQLATEVRAARPYHRLLVKGVVVVSLLISAAAIIAALILG